MPPEGLSFQAMQSGTLLGHSDPLLGLQSSFDQDAEVELVAPPCPDLTGHWADASSLLAFLYWANSVHGHPACPPHDAVPHEWSMSSSHTVLPQTLRLFP